MNPKQGSSPREARLWEEEFSISASEQSYVERRQLGRFLLLISGAMFTGQLWLVANRHLPYEVVLAEGFESVNVITQQQGFKIVAATRAPAVMSRDAATGRRARK